MTCVPADGGGEKSHVLTKFKSLGESVGKIFGVLLRTEALKVSAHKISWLFHFFFWFIFGGDLLVGFGWFHLFKNNLFTYLLNTLTTDSVAHP